VSKGSWKLTPHLDLLNRRLLDLAAGKVRRLMVSMPPRHGKSELISRYLPAWYLGTFPDRRVILSSYESDFAASWGRKARELLEQHGLDHFGAKVRSDIAASSRWEIAGHDGGMITAGVGGPITGRGANLLIVDDPIKNAEDAASLTLRDKIYEWWRSTAYTRLEPGASVVLIQTRWHQDDLAGRILADADQGEAWEVISLPAIAEENDPLGRDPGAALWPERFSEEALDVIRRSVGSYFWAAMYQQTPVPIGGEIFKQEWFRYVDSVPENADRVVRYWDKAATAGGGDFSCGVLILSHDGRFFVADVIRGQWSPHRRNEVIEATTVADGERFGKRQ
jgi:hypothetical protein